MTRPWRGTLIFIGTAAAIGAVAASRYGATGADVAAVPAPTASPAAAAQASPNAASGTSTTAPATTPSPSPAATSGGEPAAEVTVTGTAVQTRYGPVQVAVTFDGSTITNVVTVQAPGGERESVQINAKATPILAEEVLQAQSATIDTVSGATYTSDAYRTSVQSAIDQQG